MSEHISPELPEINLYEVSVADKCQSCPVLSMDIEEFQEAVSKYDRNLNLFMNPRFSKVMRTVISSLNPEYSQEELEAHLAADMNERKGRLEREARHLSFDHAKTQDRVNGATEACEGLGIVEAISGEDNGSSQAIKYIIDYCRSQAMPESAVMPARVTRKPVSPEN